MAWHHAWTRTSVAVVVGVLLGLLGGWAGVLLAGATTEHVGPLTIQTELAPSWGGHTQIELPPLGSVQLATHRGPVGLTATVESVDVTEATTWLTNAGAQGIQDQVAADVRSAAEHAVERSVVAALLGAFVVTAAVTRRRTSVVAGVVAVTLACAGTGLVAVRTWDADAIREPTFTGALTNAPRVVADLSAIPDNLDRYGTELAGLVDNVAALSGTLNNLPINPDASGTVKVLHVSDIHLAVQAWPLIREVAAQYHVDVIVDTGDVADHGTAAENAALAGIGGLGVPYLFVKGNHDSAVTVAKVASFPNATVLDDSRKTVAGLTFAGAGDPRLTPDKSTRDDSSVGDTEVIASATTLATYVASQPGVDVVLFHDPQAAGVLDGTAPTLLFGHLHVRSTWLGDKGSRIFVQGSTGGAGLRALQGERPTPVMLSVLYFDRATGKVTAFDDITLGGLGTTSAQVQRHTVRADGTTSVDQTPADVVVPTTSTPVPQ